MGVQMTNRLAQLMIKMTKRLAQLMIKITKRLAQLMITITKRLAQMAMSKKVNCQQELTLWKVLMITITRRSLSKEACQCLLKASIRVKWQEPAPERKKTKNVLDLGIV